VAEKEDASQSNESNASSKEVLQNGSGARFSKAPETFRVRKAIFTSSSSLSKDGDVYAPETSCMKGTSAHIENM